jgi:hypothetical protein
MQTLIARPVSPNGTRYSREAGKFGGIQSRNADRWRSVRNPKGRVNYEPKLME